jgi:hypothetical protein
MAKVVVLNKPEPPDALMSRRAELQAETQRLNKVAHARAAIEARLAELDAEQRSIDGAEREAWRVWAAAAEGPPPSPQLQERESIDQRRGLLAADLAGALNGERAIQPRLAELNAELLDIGRQIFARHVDALLTEAEAVNAELHTAAAEFLRACQRADGIKDAFLQATAQAVNGGDAMREAALRGAFSQLERLERPSLVADAGRRAQHAADFRRRLI